MLTLHNLSLRRGSRLLFEAADLTVYARQKVGLTGANGCGKSSLFALILGELHPDAGDFFLPSGLEIAHVAQETPAVADAAVAYVMAGDRQLLSLQRQLAASERMGDGLAQAELHAQLDAIDGYSARSRAARLMRGLGFVTEQEEQPVKGFSGGWRMRLNLARALMCRSDLLLLDEPTNHLDLDAVLWLEDWLRLYAGTLLLISHDREFLDAVTTHIAHIERQRIRLYRGNYSSFEQQRVEQLARQQGTYARQQREIAHIKRYVERFRAKATKARQAQSRLKALERMELIGPAHVDSPFGFGFRRPEKAPSPLLRLAGVSVGYGGRSVLQKLNLALAPGDRVGLLGPNGAGKSTLVKLLAGTMSPAAGEVRRAQGLVTGYFAQHQLEQLDSDQSPLQHLRRLDRRSQEQELRDFLGGFGFRGERALAPVAPLSGGEKARLVLALLVYRRPNLLLLDEPTNHLDLEMRLALGNALQEFVGAMVIVSHDRHLLRIACDRLLLVHAGQVEPFAGGLDEYPAWIAETQRHAAPLREAEAANVGSATARRERKRLAAQQRSRLQPLRARARELEDNIDRLSVRQRELEQELALPDLYLSGRKPRLLALMAEKQVVDQGLGQAEEEWITVHEALEAAEASSV